MAQQSSALPSIFGYTDLRAFLQDWLAAKVVETPDYTLGRFARRAQLSSSHVRSVFNGNRDLKSPCVDGFVRALGLKGYEPLYLYALCRYARSVSISERGMILRELAVIVVRAGAPVSEPHVLACWLDLRNMVALEASHAPSFRDDPVWLSRAMGVHPDDAADALRELKAAGLLVQDASGRWGPKAPVFSTALGDDHPLIVRFRQFALVSAQRAHWGRGPDRRFLSLQLPVMEEDLPELQGVTEELYHTIRDKMRAHEMGPDSTRSGAVYGLIVGMRVIGGAVDGGPLGGDDASDEDAEDEPSASHEG